MAEHFGEQFNESSWTADFLFMPTNEIMAVDITLLLEMEVNRKIRLPKEHKAAGPDGLFLFFINADGELLALELTKLRKQVLKTDVSR